MKGLRFAPSRWIRFGAEIWMTALGLTREPTVVYATGLGATTTGSGESLAAVAIPRSGSHSMESNPSSQIFGLRRPLPASRGGSLKSKSSAISAIATASLPLVDRVSEVPLMGRSGVVMARFMELADWCFEVKSKVAWVGVGSASNSLLMADPTPKPSKMLPGLRLLTERT